MKNLLVIVIAVIILIIVFKNKVVAATTTTTIVKNNPTNSTNLVTTLTIPKPIIPSAPNIASVKPLVVASSQGLAAAKASEAAAKADDKVYAQFQSLVKRAQLRSGPTQSAQWNSLLAGNLAGLVPDASFDVAEMAANLATSNLQNTIAIQASGANSSPSRVGALE